MQNVIDNSLSIGFGIVYANKLRYSEVVMHDNFYQIYFDSKPVAEIVYTMNFKWILSSGVVLPQIIIDEIGNRIENAFD